MTNFILYSGKTSTAKRNSRILQGGTAEVFPKSIKWWERSNFVVEQRSDDMTIVLDARYNKRPDLLAKQLYDNSEYEWILLMYNKIVDVNEEFITGKEIRAPSLRTVKTVILTKSIR